MKKKKNLKGMTLVEVLVAMTIFAIMAMLMAVMVSFIYRTNLKTNQLNAAFQPEGNIAENSDKANAKQPSSGTLSPTIGGHTFNMAYDSFKTGDYGENTDTDGDGVKESDELHFNFFLPKP